MKYNGQLQIAVGSSARTKIWKNTELAWSEMVKRLTTENQTAETLEEYKNATKTEKLKIKDVGGFVAGYIKTGRRKPENIESKQILILDMDYAHLNIWDDVTLLYGNALVLHATHSHSEENPRYRLIIPLLRKVTAEEYEPIARRIAETIGIDLFDGSTFEWNRLFFWPSNPRDVPYYCQVQDGPWLDPDEILGSYTDWKDSSSWPRAENDTEKIHTEVKKQADPTIKDGIVGAFCRIYTITEAIETFLSEVYESAEDGRYTYMKGTTASGLIIYQDKFAYSHHDTDPAGGKLSNAFDLIRIHKFGDGDESFNSMEDFCLTDDKVKQAVINGSVSEAKSDFTEEKTCNYIRVGISYYKKILKADRQGIEKEELKVWNRNTIIEDHKRSFLKVIPKFDDFVMKPNNLEIQSVINNCYNLYSKFTHTPKPGEWIWTERLMQHIFGDQYDQGMRYMQMLYLHPERSTIILAIVSQKKGTGKTTFVNWINMLFDANVALISSTDFISSFNPYGTKNIIVIEETLLEKKLSIEKLKALATAKHIQINEKFVAQYKIPFYGKVILTSNNEDRFAQIDEEEIRFFVRKVGMPKHENHKIEDDLLIEIPAFLDHLKSLPPVDWSVSRSGFTNEELANEALHTVVEESRSTLYKDLEIIIIDFFDNNEDREFFFATPTNFKIDFFFSNNNITTSYISRVLRKEFKMEAEKVQRYKPFNEETEQVGRPYCFYREDFVTM